MSRFNNDALQHSFHHVIVDHHYPSIWWKCFYSAQIIFGSSLLILSSHASFFSNSFLPPRGTTSWSQSLFFNMKNWKWTQRHLWDFSFMAIQLDEKVGTWRENSIRRWIEEIFKKCFVLKDGDVVVKDLKEEVVTDIMATIHQMKRGEREDGLFIYLLRLLISHTA